MYVWHGMKSRELLFLKTKHKSSQSDKNYTSYTNNKIQSLLWRPPRGSCGHHTATGSKNSSNPVANRGAVNNNRITRLKHIDTLNLAEVLLNC